MVLAVHRANGRSVDSYVVRIYRRAGTKSRILVGTVEAAGAGRRMAFSNSEELWELLGRRRSRDIDAPTFPKRCPREEVTSAAVGSDREKTVDGGQPNPPLGIERRGSG